MEYKETEASGNSYSHMWDVATMKHFDGGFSFDKTSVPAGTEKLPKGVLLKVDLTERTAKVIKTAVLYEALTAEATAVKVKKGALLVATDILGNGAKAVTVGTIDTSNANYDSFSITANALGTAAEGAVLQTYDAAGASGKSAVNPDGLNPFEVILDAEPSCSCMFRVDGVVVSRLPQSVTTAIKSALTNVQFLNI